MAAQETQNSGKNVRRWPWIAGLSVIAAIVLLRLSLKTPIAHHLARSLILENANTVLNARVDIREVRGDLLQEITLIGVSVTRPGTLLNIDTLYATYDPYSYFSSEFKVGQVRVSGPVVNIVQDREGYWNVQDLLREREESPPVEGSPLHFKIDRFTFRNGSVNGRFATLGDDSLLAVREFNMEGDFGYYGEQYELRVRELAFNIEQSRLTEPVRIESEAEAVPASVTLEKLLVATGASVVQSSAVLNLSDSTASLSLSARPLSWRDLSAYIGAYPVQEDLQLDLGLKGNFESFDISINARADGLRDFVFSSALSWTDELVLERLDLSSDYTDLSRLFSESGYPSFGSVNASVSGRVPLLEFERSEFTGTYRVTGLRQSGYYLDTASGSFTVKDRSLRAGLILSRAAEEADLNLTADGIWSDVPSFTARFNMRNLQPAYWLQDQEYRGTLNGSGTVSGQGYTLADRFWDYRLDLTEGEIAGQPFSSATFRGSVNGDRFDTRSNLRLVQSEFELRAEVDNYRTAPAYRYDLAVRDFNMAECRGLEEFSTMINGRLEGQGRYVDPERLELTSSVRIDSSIVNGEFIEGLDASLRVRDTVAHVDSARLRSAIADGGFDARIHLLDWYNIENRLDLDLNVKDIRSLAPLAGVEDLQTEGSVRGTLTPIYGNNLQFSSNVVFTDLVYGDMFSSETAEGEIRILVVEEPEYVLNMNLANPVIRSVVLQDMEMTTSGIVAPDSTAGDFQLTFSSASENRIQHFGSYRIFDDRTTIQTIDLQLVSRDQKLQLDREFETVITESSFRIDTVRLASDDGAYIEFAVPFAGSDSQRGFLEGRDLNLTVLQNTLLNRSFFEGVLSGRLYLERRETAISATGDLSIRNLVYGGAVFDSLTVKYELDEERLEGGMAVFDGRDRLVEGQLRIPFKLGDPDTFGSSFFEKRVDGYLRVNSVSAGRFSELLTSAGFADTEGMVQFDGTLSGRAGRPEIEASFQMTEARISGVAVDRLSATLDYAHDEQQLDLMATVVSLKQKAAEINSRIPVHVDLTRMNLELPGEDDSIYIEMATNRFNLASFNDFVSRTELREISGSLDGRVVVEGPLNDLQTDGKLTLSGGAVRIVRAGVKIEDIRSTLIFDRNTVQISEFAARSNNGRLTAGGSLDLDRLSPSNIDVSINARNFRLANTPEYNAIVNMNARMGGTFFRPRLEGKLSFVSGYLYLQNFGERSVEAVELDTVASTYYDYYVRYDSLSLDMDISFNRRFFVRNRRFLDLEYELAGQLDLLKDAGEDLQLFGTLNAVSGYARPLGKRFQLEEGAITFVGDPANPTMNIRHLFEPPQPQARIRIWYVIEGPVVEPKFKYESDPPMELENIISYTLFGQPFYALDSWKQVVASSGSNTGAADVAMDVLLDKVETLATRKLGIDVVQIDNTRTSGNAGTSIKTGWYISPKVFFAIQNEIAGSSPDTIFILEYLLKENLKLIITQGSDNSSGIDLNWNYDY